MLKYRRTLLGALALTLGLALILAWAAGPGVRAQDEATSANQAPLAPEAPSGTAFTYQGQLSADGSTAAGPCDFRFVIYDSAVGGAQVGPILTETDVALSDGRFTAILDFGVGVFTGDARWLEIAVQCAGDAAYTTLGRQALKATPYALYAMDADKLDGQHGSAYASTVHNHLGQTWSGNGAALTIRNVGYLTATLPGSLSAVQGEAANWIGVLGVSGSSIGVLGSSNGGSGVAGISTSGSGVAGISTNDSGVAGTSTSASGVAGTSTDGTGVQGESTNATGVHGESTDGTGVYGESTDGTGVYGESTHGYGVFGASLGGTGGYFRAVNNSQSDVVLGGGDNTGDDGTLSSDLSYNDSDVFIRSNDEVWIYLDDNNNTTSEFRIYNGDGAVVHKITETGLKSAVLQTDSYGQRAVYTIESPEVWLEDFGNASLVDGKVGVAFDSMFAETVNRDLDYHVFLTPVCQEPVLLFVTEKTAAGFTVGGVTLDGQPAACGFDYRVTAKRLGVEDIRLEEVTDDEKGQR